MAVTREIGENMNKNSENDFALKEFRHGRHNAGHAFEVCPHCGSVVANKRGGVPMTPLKSRIFDLIQLQPGISNRDLCKLIYESVTPQKMIAIRSHISQIREKLMNSGITVQRSKKWGYRIGKGGFT